MRFNKLIISENAEPRYNKRNKQIRRVKCQRDCGQLTIVDVGKLNRTKSCGCLGHAGLNRKYDQWYTEFLLFKRRNARRKNIKWCLSFDQFKSLCTQNCVYCSAAPAIKVRSGKTLFRNSIDRINNDLDYTTENSAPCCSMCNFMKSSMPPDKFIEHCVRIATFVQRSR